MEIRHDVLIVMTPDGRFMNGKKTPNRHYSIGEEIPFYPVNKDKRVAVKKNWKAAASILTAAILMIALFATNFLQGDKAYAYVSMDINPSLELSLDKEQQVIDITPYNEDGKVLIKRLEDWKNEEVSDVAEEILRLSEKLGYLKNGQDVWITSTITDLSEDESHSAFLKDLNDFVENYNNMHSAEIIINETTNDVREEAVKKGMTAGTLLKETVDKDKKTIVNPVEGKEESPSKKEMEDKKAENPAVSVPNQSVEKEEKNKPKQNNNPASNGKSNGNGMNQGSGQNKGSERNDASSRNASSQKERGESDHRSQNHKRDNNSSTDDRQKKNGEEQGKSIRHENQGNGHSDSNNKKNHENNNRDKND
ncbi:anti-sigma-I factor RsgI family protein [Rossellomorea sp. NS-SX7]|uniref:anti-sigma-I factor RsgI family protein n=1 Tax=Rossellomorea sp. NS-SX7 TaxID=3463856 RepID=UPI00405835EE